MNTTNRASEKDGLSALQDRLREPLEKVQAKAEKRLKQASKMVVAHPARSLAVAFVVGFGLARLLQKLS